MRKSRKILVLALTVLLAVSLWPAGKAAAEGEEIDSGYYGIARKEGVIGQIAEGTVESDLFSRVLADGELSLSGGVKTGSVLSLSGEEGVSDSLTLAVLADVNGDGAFSVSDMLMVKSSLLGMQKFSSAQKAAGDINGDGGVTITDFLQMKSRLLGIVNFTPHPVSGAEVRLSVILTPGDSYEFGDASGTAVVEGDAVTWASGRVRAESLGSARVSAGGKTLWVTVCSVPLKVTLPSNELVLGTKDTQTMQPSFNHPVSTEITWSVSDTKVAKIDGKGVVTGLREGTADITATLPNGQKATQSLRVLPLIKSLELSEDSLKLRHNGGTKSLVYTFKPESANEAVVWTSSNPAVVTVDESGNIKGKKDGTATVTCTSKYGGVKASCTVRVCDVKQVALTFDDGPHGQYTAKVLDMLKDYGVHATFFMVGSRIKGNESLLRRMADEGHELGYHTWNHTYLFNMNAAQIKADFDRFQKAVRNACGKKATVFRSPGGNITDTALKTIDLPHILWSIDTRDWEHRDPSRVRSSVINGFSQDGAIILCHDIHGTTYTGVLAALQEMKRRDMDVELLTVTQLLSRKGTPPKAGTTYKKAS